MSTLIRLAIAAATVAVASTTSPPAMARSIDGHSHQAQNRLERKLAHLDRHLTHAVRDARLSRLTEVDRSAFKANVVTDHTTITAVGDALAADGNVANVSAVRAVLDDFRPRAYVVGVNIVRHAERVTAKIAELTTAVPADSTQATDLAAASTLLATVSAGTFTASTDGPALRAAQHAVAAAQALVGQVADATDGTTD